MARFAVASAAGFRVHADRLAAALVNVPGYGLKKIVSDGKRVRGDPEAIIAEHLRSDARQVTLDLDGRSDHEWGYLWASKTKMANLAEFDTLEMNWAEPVSEPVIAAFATISEAAVAEFGYLDVAEPFAGYQLQWAIPNGLPGVAPIMWVGSQLAAFYPRLVSEWA